MNISTTKKHLTAIFTLVVFLIIIVLGVSFFSIKYYKELGNEKQILNDIGDDIEKGKISIDEFVRQSRSIGKDIKKGDIGEDFKKRGATSGGKFIPHNPVNYIYIKQEDTISTQEIEEIITSTDIGGESIEKSEFISFDIKEDISNDLFKEFLNLSDISRATKQKGFILRTIELENEKLILFQPLRYNGYDYLSDIGIYILVTLLFSGFFYLVGSRFIHRVFIPVERNMADMNNFIHNAGHELKTPIAVIDSNIQFIKDTKTYDEPMIDEMKEETQKLNSLIDTLIQLSDIGELKAGKKECNLKSVIDEVITNYESSISEKEINIKVKIPNYASTEANEGYLYIFVSNLIGNAIKYNNKKGSIIVEYQDDAMTIQDTGLGIKKEEVEKIFDRFYKVDSSRNTEGFGIGLSLVKKIADMYGWSIKVESEEGKGSKFMIRFI